MEFLELKLEVRGEIIESNADVFAAEVDVALADINLEPKTDEEFGEADRTAKQLKEAESAIASARLKAMAEAKELNAVFSTLEQTGEKLRGVRLKLEKAVKGAKETIRQNAINDAFSELDDLDDLGLDGSTLAKAYGQRIEKAAKGKRTQKTLAAALNQEVLLIRAEVRDAWEILKKWEEAHGGDLTTDTRQLLTTDPEKLEGELNRRLDVANARAQAKEAEEKANALQKQAEEEKRQREEESKPVPSLETDADEVEEEWKRFSILFLEALSPVRAARAELKHPTNKQRAQKLAEAIGSAWSQA